MYPFYKNNLFLTVNLEITYQESVFVGNALQC